MHSLTVPVMPKEAERFQRFNCQANDVTTIYATKHNTFTVIDFKLMVVFLAVHSGAWGSKKTSTIRVLSSELHSYAVGEVPPLSKIWHIAMLS